MLGGRPIVSRAGAMGLMQLMPDTWREMRAALSLGSDPFDPHDNILAGTAYLRLTWERFGYPGMFAAYNAGPARYGAYLAGRGTLPGETRAYLATVAGAVPGMALGSGAGLFVPLATVIPAAGWHADRDGVTAAAAASPHSMDGSAGRGASDRLFAVLKLR